ELQRRVDHVRVDRSLLDYIIAIANATRQHEELRLGVSPRGALALAQAARASAVLAGRDYAIPEDILSNVIPVCSHRVVARGYVHGGDPDAAAAVLRSILETVRSPA